MNANIGRFNTILTIIHGVLEITGRSGFIFLKILDPLEIAGSNGFIFLDVLCALEIIVSSGFIFTDVLPCAVKFLASRGLNICLCALEISGSSGCIVLDISLCVLDTITQACVSFFIAIINALLDGYAKSQRGKYENRRTYMLKTGRRCRRDFVELVGLTQLAHVYPGYVLYPESSQLE